MCSPRHVARIDKLEDYALALAGNLRIDRLLVVHALLRRWKLAMADEVILANMPAAGCIEL